MNISPIAFCNKNNQSSLLSQVLFWFPVLAYSPLASLTHLLQIYHCFTFTCFNGRFADAHKSGLSMQHVANSPTTSTPCVSLHRPRAPGKRSSQMSFTPALGTLGKKRFRPWRRPPPLRSSRSPPATASFLSARWNVAWRCDRRRLHHQCFCPDTEGY